jgi:hypothetical protein
MHKDHRKLRLLCTLLSMLAALSVAADDERSGYWSVQLENDFFAQSGDRYYTHGTQISYLTRAGPGTWLTRAAGLFPFFHLDDQATAINHTLGQKIFTPDDTESSQLVEDDRPYAGYLYYNVTLLSRIERGPQLDSANMLGFTLGVVGPSSRAEQAQTWFHERIDVESPNGWDNQLRDELALGISYSRVWSIVTPATSHFEFGIMPHVTAVLGNVYVYGAGGVMFRFGTHLRGDMSPPNISPGFPGASVFDVDRKYNWYFFAGHESRMMGHNIFLDGNTNVDSHSVDKERLVGDHQYGFAIQFNRVRIAISNMIRTKEYTTQRDQTKYGAINISFVLE